MYPTPPQSCSGSASSGRHSNESDSSNHSADTLTTSTSASTRPSLREARSQSKPSSTPHYPLRPVIVHRPKLPLFGEVSYDPEAQYSAPYTPPRDSFEDYAPKSHVVYDELDDFEVDHDDHVDLAYDTVEELRHVRKLQPTDFEVYKSTTPQDFAEYFPSQRRLFIHHDETTPDGDMNIKVDTEDMDRGMKTHVQLFHLKMEDPLELRKFSLRRYCRSSGREVCHTRREFTTPANERPMFQRSMSNVVAGIMRSPGLQRMCSKESARTLKATRSAPAHTDSGYASDEDCGYFDDYAHYMPAENSHTCTVDTPQHAATNTIRFEFSNYAHVSLKRAGSKSTKRYDFEYWGSNYSWKRVVDTTGAVKSVKFHLIRHGDKVPIAHIIPVMQTPEEVREEHAKGGWVPPCSLWISDPAVLTAFTDVADVIVSTGLVALVDDCIKSHHKANTPKPKHQVSIPLTPLKMEMGFETPKALANMFRRRSSVQSSPLRFSSHAEIHQ